MSLLGTFIHRVSTSAQWLHVLKSPLIRMKRTLTETLPIWAYDEEKNSELEELFGPPEKRDGGGKEQKKFRKLRFFSAHSFLGGAGTRH